METIEIIIFSIIGVFVLILLICIGIQFYFIKKLFKNMSVLDPISSYKKVGPSLYIKRANLQNISSVSSSLKHFYGESRTSNNLGAQNPRNYEDIGTLDRNFFTNTNFNYDNHLMFTDGQEGNSLTNASNSNKSNTLESKEKEAISQLESILY